MIFFLVILITTTVYLFTSHGHRYTPDEYYTYNQAYQILNHEPIPDFVPGETRVGLQGIGFITAARPICLDPILCSLTPIGQAVTYIPFIFIEQTFHIIPDLIWTEDDFSDPHYVGWRNSLTHEETFTFLFYGSIITALSTGVLFLLARSYDYSRKISIFITMITGFSTIIWSYSNTGLSVVPEVLFVLVSLLFYRKFIKNQSTINLVFCGLSLGFGVTIRYDMAIFAALLSGFVIYEIIRKNNHRIIKLIGFLGPLILFGIILIGINEIRFGSALEFGYGSEEGFFAGHTTPVHVGVFGLLFSPGAGIFIFSPILLTAFVTFVGFYKKHKTDTVLFLAFFASILIFFGSFHAWHGFVGWSARYMLPAVPLLLLPLGTFMEKRKNRLIISASLVLAGIGSLFNIAWLIQDVSWFVWGLMGGNTGLFSLGNAGMHPLRMNPVVFWTFEYSQLTHALSLMFTKLQPDLILLKIFGIVNYCLILCMILIPSSLALVKLHKNSENKQ